MKILSWSGAVIVLTILLFTRLAWSASITPSLTHDELIYAGNAKAISLWGHDVTGTHGWFDLTPVHPMYAEWTASLMAPFFWLIKDPILATHALPTLFSLTLPFIFAWFVYGLFKDMRLSLIAGILLTISPLAIQFSKLTYDSFFSLFFYVLGGAIYLNLKNRQKWWAIPILIVGFFNYQGYKLLLLPWTLFLWSWQLWGTQTKKKELSFLPLFGLIVTLMYGLILLPKQATVSRLSQTIFSDKAQIEAVTYARRKASLAPALGVYVSNRLSSSLELGLDNFLQSINPTMLFLRGEPAESGFALWTHGFFYVLDGLLIGLGLVKLFSDKKYTSKAILILLMLLASLIPTTVSTISHWYLLRCLFAYFWLYIFMAFGFQALMKYRFPFLVVSLLYVGSFLNFAYQYFYQYPLYRSDSAELHEAIAVNYAARASSLGSVIVYDDEPHYLYLSHLLYGNAFSSVDAGAVASAFASNRFQIGQITYANLCQPESNPATIVISDLYDPCDKAVRSESVSIVSLIDGGKKYRIQADRLCGAQPLNPYIRKAKLSEMNFRQPDDASFCQAWITDQTL